MATNGANERYFGHGGAEQYIRSFKIRHLKHCANVMLWGCSSGALKDQGDFDRVGTALNYMIAGAYVLSSAFTNALYSPQTIVHR